MFTSAKIIALSRMLSIVQKLLGCSTCKPIIDKNCYYWWHKKGLCVVWWSKLFIALTVEKNFCGAIKLVSLQKKRNKWRRKSACTRRMSTQSTMRSTFAFLLLLCARAVNDFFCPLVYWTRHERFTWLCTSTVHVRHLLLDVRMENVCTHWFNRHQKLRCLLLLFVMIYNYLIGRFIFTHKGDKLFCFGSIIELRQMTFGLTKAV